MDDKRRGLYKKSLDGDSCRRRRGEEGVIIRKQKREESLSKRRFLSLEGEDDASTQPAAIAGATPAAAGGFVQGGAAQHGATAVPPAAAGTSNRPVGPRLEDLPRFAADLRSGNPQAELEATRAVRKLLSVERKPPVEEVLAQGVLPILVDFLRREGTPCELQFEAAWALTNIASTDHTKKLVEAGATPYLARLLLSASADVREQAAWCLGNIAGDSPELRDIVLNSQALGPLLKNIEHPSSTSMLRNCVWSLSNFCRGKPQPHVDLLRPAFPLLAKVLAGCGDTDCLQDAAWALSYVSDGDNQRIQAVIEAGVTPHLVRYLGHDQATVVTPMLRTLGNLVSGDDLQTQAVLDAGVLLYMPALLRNSKKNIRKETCWLLSNIAAGNPNQVSALVAAKGVLPMVITQMASGEWDVRREAAWVVSNVATGGSLAHIRHLVEDCDCMRPLCDLLDVGDAKMIEVALDALEAILKAGEAAGDGYLTLLHEADGHDRLERLQEHANEKIYRRAVALIERYLGVDEDEDGEDGAHYAAVAAGAAGSPAVSGAGTFGFPAAAGPQGFGGVAPTAVGGGGGGFNFAHVPRHMA